MPSWMWTAVAVAVVSVAVALIAPRLRHRAQRGLYGERVFDARIRSLGPSRHGLSRAWSPAAGAVVSDDGDLRWRGTKLRGGRLADRGPRRPRGRELLLLDPWAQVWTVAFEDGTRVELALAPADARHLRPWRGPGS